MSTALSRMTNYKFTYAHGSQAESVPLRARRLSQRLQSRLQSRLSKKNFFLLWTPGELWMVSNFQDEISMANLTNLSSSYLRTAQRLVRGHISSKTIRPTQLIIDSNL